MKRALRIVIPLLLVLAVLCTTAWYFLVYDKDLTKELILRGARTLEDRGKHEAAAWMYDLAYSQSSQEDDVAIELSNQYRDIGNYTKAEYALTEAISQNPTTALYIELSKLYVEQDKLLDAVNLIDTVLDPQIKQDLEQQRPAPPTVSYEPGFYTEYISVAVSVSDGTLYVSSDADYPSVEKDLYEAPIDLLVGETALYCLNVGSNGLVSKLGLFEYTIGGVVEEVTFTDSAIETAVRQLINTGENTPIFTNELWNITTFTVPEDAVNYTDLAHLTKLQTLYAAQAGEGLLSGMGKLENLEELTLTDSSLNEADLLALGELTTLKRLSLPGCNLSSISSLQALTGLEYLDLSRNTLRNLNVLGQMYSLKELYLANNAVTDLNSLKDLASLTVLDISHNSISSLGPICGITGITALYAGQNQIADITQIKQLTSLVELDLSFNAVADVSALAACQAIEILNISNNTVADISMLSTLKNLQQFNLSHNQIPALPEFSADSPLVSIDASHNLLEDIEALTSLAQLNSVNIDYNEAVESLEPLRECPVLIQVNAFGTMVTEVSFLTEQSIVVNYDPTL